MSQKSGGVRGCFLRILEKENEEDVKKNLKEVKENIMSFFRSKSDR